MFAKSKPWRSAAYMRFCHQEMKPAPCCVCGERPWVALHHFGDDGGQGMKPSDSEVARVCMFCHGKWDFKRRALIRSREPLALDVLESYQDDALKLNRAYLAYLESQKVNSVLPPAPLVAEEECALEELNLWLVTDGPGLGPDQQRDWLLSWANRRAANVIGFLAEPMLEIATGCDSAESAVFVARQALRVSCLEGVEEDGQDKDRVVR